MLKFLFVICLIIEGISLSLCFAQSELNKNDPALKAFNALYKDAKYEEALEALKEVKTDALAPKNRFYYLGITHSKLLNYEKAIEEFKEAVRAGCDSPALQYEYGQALYANNELHDARDAFIKSSNTKYNYIPSIYYIAYISELMEEYTLAKHNYVKIIKYPNVDQHMHQVALFQYAKILLEMLRKQDRTLIYLDREVTKNIPKYVLPILNKAYNLNPDADIAGEINKLIKDLTKEFSLDANIMANGRRVSKNRRYTSFTTRLKHDDNWYSKGRGVAYQEHEFYTKYMFVRDKRIITTPDIRITNTKFRNQKDSAIFSKDSFGVYTNLKNRIEHKAYSQPASAIFDFDFSKTYKDLNKDHTFKPYARNFGWAIGEQFNYFSAGETTLKLKVSDSKDMTDDFYNTLTNTFSYDQNIYVNQGQQLLALSASVSQSIYKYYRYLNTNSYTLSATYLLFEVLPDSTLTLGMSTTVTDPKLQRESRGYEINFNPSIDFSVTLFNYLNLSINYNYSNTTSKDILYVSRNQVVGTELSVSF
jgi:tetratricopeptide (TPR) repeat protein